MNSLKLKEKCVLRVAEIFQIPAANLDPGLRFGEDLKPSFISDFKENELDQISNDIHDMADRKAAAELKSGKLIIRTVQDYCDFMVRCSETNPKGVGHLFKIS